MNAKQFLKYKGKKEIIRLSDGGKTGEYIVTPELMEEFSKQYKTN